jgi:hypothetical protein
MLLGALEYLANLGGTELDVATFEAAGGVGEETTPEQIKEAVDEVIGTTDKRHNTDIT